MECSCMALITATVMVMMGLLPTVVLEYADKWVVFVMFVFKGMFREFIMVVHIFLSWTVMHGEGVTGGALIKGSYYT